MNTKRIVKKINKLNALVAHRNESGHFRFKNAVWIKRESNLLRRKCIESALIARSSTINLRPGSYNILPFSEDLLISQCGRLMNKSDKNKKHKETELNWLFNMSEHIFKKILKYEISVFQQLQRFLSVHVFL